MQAPSESKTERRRWNGARNRDRNQARFLIRERIASACSGTTSSNAFTDCGSNYDEQSFDEYHDEIESCFRAVSLKSACTFSLKKVASNYALLSRHLPAKFMSPYKIKTLCTSRYGTEFAEAALMYSNLISKVTLIEYASMLGEFGVVSSLLSGGINPCNLQHLETEGRNDVHAVEMLVMKKLLADFVPRSLTVYIIRRLFCMKMWSLVRSNVEDENYDDDTSNLICPLCSMPSTKHHPLVTFDAMCRHACCEACIWEKIVTKLDYRYEGDVVRCPICGENKTSHGHNHDSEQASDYEDEYVGRPPLDRSILSRTKFRALPETSEELRALPKRRKANRAIHSTWNTALLPTIGSSQDVRGEKFYRYITQGAKHHCRACLRAGVEVNMTNEYNQTPLYIACWMNHVEIVKLLLDWGADPCINANGQMTTWNVAKENGCDEIVKLLRSFHIDDEIAPLRSLSIREKANAAKVTPGSIASPRLQTLISRDSSHIGAGSCIIDYAVGENILQFLESLFSSLPVAPPTQAGNKKKKIEDGIPCSVRHYFCDSEQYLSRDLSARIESIINTNHTDGGHMRVTMFQQMRFLNYLSAGSALAPHVDLAKVDTYSDKGRSTHTFILYLSDCEEGGETALLRELSPDGPHADHEVLASATPLRGRMLIFPHQCPHEGKEVVSTPKILLRGELRIE